MAHNFLKGRVKSMPKFNIGQYVYGSFSSTVSTLKKVETCPICHGTASITYNSQDIKCPNCEDGTKTTRDDNVFFQRHSYENKARLISEVCMNFNKDTQTIEYCVGNHRCSEDKLFSTFDESRENCRKLNSILEQKEREKYGSKYDEKCVPVIDYSCQADTSNQKKQEQTAMSLELISCQYDFEETLYYIQNQYKKITYDINCSVCKSSGVIEVHGKVFPCPECSVKKINKDKSVCMPSLKSLTLNTVQIIIKREPYLDGDFIKNPKVIKRDEYGIIRCKYYCTDDNCHYLSESSCVRNPLLELRNIEFAYDRLIEDTKSKYQCDISKECFNNIKDIKENIRETTKNDFNIAFMNIANRSNVEYYLSVYNLDCVENPLQKLGGIADIYNIDASNLTPELFLLEVPAQDVEGLSNLIRAARNEFSNPETTNLFG